MHKDNLRIIKLISLVFLILVIIISFNSKFAFAADRYWVGGTATWNATIGTKWATCSGCTGGAAVPTSSDNVYFDANSGAVTITAGATINALDFNCTGFTGSFSQNSRTFNVYGNFVLNSTMSYSVTSGVLTFLATSTGKTITTATKTIGAMTFNSSTGGWKFLDATTSTGTVTLTSGDLNLNDLNHTFSIFSSSGSTARTVHLGSGTLTLTAAATAWTTATTTNLTIDESTSNIIFTSTTASVSFGSSGDNTFYNFEFTGAGSHIIAGTPVFNNFKINPSSVAWNYVRISSGITVNGILTLNGYSEKYRTTISLQDSPSSTRTTITANGTITGQYVNFRDVAGNGSADWNLSGVIGGSGNNGNNSGITFTTAANQYWVGNGGNWDDSANHWASTSNGAAGSGRVPLCQDTAKFDSNSFSLGSQTITANFTLELGGIDFTGVLNSPTLDISTGSKVIDGNLTFVSGMTFTATSGTWYFENRSGVQTLNFAGKVFSGSSNLYFQSLGATTQLTNNINNNTGGIYFVMGTFDANDYNVFTSSINGSSSYDHVIYLGSGNWYLWNSSPVSLNSAHSTLYSETSTIIITNSQSDTSFTGGGKIYYNLNTGSSSDSSVKKLTITDSGNIFNNIIIGKLRELRLTSATTTTIQGDLLTTSDVEKLAYLTSTTPGESDLSWMPSAISSDGSKIIAGTYGNRIYISTNVTSGNAWSETTPTGTAENKNWRISSMSADGSIIFAGYDAGASSRVYLSTNSGASWAETLPAGATTKYWDDSAMSSDGNKIFVAVYAGRLYVTTNRGSSWAETRPLADTSQNWQTVSMSDDGNVMLAGIYPGRLYLSTNGGANWTETQPAGANNKNWTMSAMDSDGSVILVGDGSATGRLYLTTNGGTNWSEATPAGVGNKTWGTGEVNSDGSIILAGVYNGRLYKSINSGASWGEIQPAGVADKPWYTSSISSDGSIMFVGAYGGRAYLSTNTGTTWIETRPSAVPAILSKTSGTVDANYLSIKDSNATGGAIFNAYNGTNTNVLGNSGWVWSAPPTTIIDANLTNPTSPIYTYKNNNWDFNYIANDYNASWTYKYDFGRDNDTNILNGVSGYFDINQTLSYDTIAVKNFTFTKIPVDANISTGNYSFVTVYRYLSDVLQDSNTWYSDDTYDINGVCGDNYCSSDETETSCYLDCGENLDVNSALAIAADENQLYFGNNNRIIILASEDLSYLGQFGNFGYGTANVISDNAISENKTHLIIQRVNNDIEIYKDSVLDSVTSIANNPSFLNFSDNNYNWYIGSKENTINGNGIIRYLKIYNRNLSSSEIYCKFKRQ
ncbi:MAG: hypothetical protein V1824_04330 [archaeon]